MAFEVTLFDENYDSQNGVAAISTCIAEGYTAICLNPTTLPRWFPH